jgi:magnesium-transporting ATPase (P-type)
MYPSTAHLNHVLYTLCCAFRIEEQCANMPMYRLKNRPRDEAGGGLNKEVGSFHVFSLLLSAFQLLFFFFFVFYFTWLFSLSLSLSLFLSHSSSITPRPPPLPPSTMRLIWIMIISLTSVHASLTVLVRSKKDSSRREKKDPPHN